MKAFERTEGAGQAPLPTEQEADDDAALEPVSREAGEDATTAGAPLPSGAPEPLFSLSGGPEPLFDAWLPGFWDALMGHWSYIDPERLRDPEPPRRWSLDDDFSAEHGYEPGFEGRSEFEHGEFERWT